VQTSVIIPCYNSARWIRETLQSIASQQLDGIEVIAVDDGSTDDSADILRREFSFVRLIQTPNRGASHARNTGTAVASGKFIQYLDADDLLAAGKIAIQIAALEKTGADVAYGDWQPLVPGENGDFVRGEVVARRLERAPEFELFDDFWCPPAAYLFRRRIVEKVGNWNEGLPIIRDARFALDCALHGGTFTYCAGVMCYYRKHANGSLSRRDPVAFNRDIYRNACEIEHWWRSHGGLTKDRIEALIQRYTQVTRSTYENDRPTFEKALLDLERLAPGFIPAQPRHFALVARLIGYRNAEAAGVVYRRAKRLFLQGQA